MQWPETQRFRDSHVTLEVMFKGRLSAVQSFFLLLLNVPDGSAQLHFF